MYLIAFLLTVIYTSELDYINQQIAILESRNMFLAYRRYRYQQYDDADVVIQQPPPTIDHIHSSHFLHGLVKLSSHKAGDISHLLTVRQEIFHLESYHNNSVVFDENGGTIWSHNSRITHYSTIKGPIYPLLAFLDSDLRLLICNSELKLTVQTSFVLKSTLAHDAIVSLYVYRHENRHIVFLISKSGPIHVFDEDGQERSIIKSSLYKIIKLVDHSPYPIIVGSQGIMLLYPVRGMYIDIGCPLFYTDILDLTTDSPYSTSLYVKLKEGLVVLSYSLKKHDKYCRVGSTINLIHESGQEVTLFYPTIIINDTFMNSSDTLLSKQLLLPIELCQQNHYETVYRRNYYYLLHRCCDYNCKTIIYKREKVYSESSKLYKFGIFIVILAVISFKIFGKAPKTTGDRKDEYFSVREQQRLTELVEILYKKKKK